MGFNTGFKGLSMVLGRASTSKKYPSARQQVERHGAVKHQDKNKTNPPSILLQNWQKVCCLRLNKLRAGRSRNLVSILFQGGSWSGRQADYVPPSSAGLREFEIHLHSPHTSYWRGTSLTHYSGRVTQICVFDTVNLGTSASSP